MARELLVADAHGPALIFDVDMHKKTSFCVTCMNRRPFIERTLPHNLALASNPTKYEFVLLDYNSSDGLGDYVRATHGADIARGLLAYYHTIEPRCYRHSHAKNCSHKLANGDVVINLDADNLLVAAYFTHVEQLRPRQLLMTHGDHNLFGRIGLYRDDFESLGGYDETMTVGWGGEDEDLIRRCEQLGFSVRSVDATEVGVHIPHSNYERTRNCEVQDMWASLRSHGEIMAANLGRDALIANQGRGWGRCRVTRNFDTEIDL